MVEVLSWFLQQVVIGDWRIFVYNIIQAIGIVIVGIAAGKTIKFIFQKIADKANLQKTIKPSFIELFLAVIKWSIYILFIDIAIEQLNVPDLTNFLSVILITIPALIGAIFLIAIGFVIASYLKDVIEESQILNWQILSNLLFFFIVYVFSVFALKIALYSFDSMVVNTIIIILTAVISVSIAFWFVKGKKIKNKS